MKVTALIATLLAVTPVVSSVTKQLNWTTSEGVQVDRPRQPVQLNVCESLQIQTSPVTDLLQFPNLTAWKTCDFEEAEQLKQSGQRSILYTPQHKCECQGELSETKPMRYLGSRIGCEDGKKIVVKVRPKIEDSWGRCVSPDCGISRVFPTRMSYNRCRRALTRSRVWKPNGKVRWLGLEYDSGSSSTNT